MLRIKRAFKECGLSQKALARATGWSPALISRVFNTGELPVDPEQFVASVVTFAQGNLDLQEWLRKEDLAHERALLEPEGSGQPGEPGDRNAYLDGQIDQALDTIFHITGFASVNGAEPFQVLALAKTCHYLLTTLRQQPLGMDALGEMEMEVNRLLQEGC